MEDKTALDKTTNAVRVVTFNVQRWVDVKGKDNIARVIETLLRLNPDVVGLQEVMSPHLISDRASGVLKKYRGKPALEAVADALGMDYIYGKEIFEKKRGGYYGNALLTRIPYASPPTRHNVKGIAGLIVADLDLDGFNSRQQEKKGKEKEKKARKEKKEKGKENEKKEKKKHKKEGKEKEEGQEKTGARKILRVGVTHLDPANEELRVRQVQEAYEVLNTPVPEEKEIYWKPYKGDPSYEEDQAKLEEMKKREAENPRRRDTAVTVPHLLMGDLNAMRESDYTTEQWQFLIEFSKKRQWTPPQSLAMIEIDRLGYKDSFHMVGEGEILTAWTDQRIFRIDYLLPSSDFPYTLLKCKTDDCTGSDHFPVWLDFEY